MGAPQARPAATGIHPGPALRPETLLVLAGLAVCLVFLALEPFLSYAVFGSDSGEYLRLTLDLVATGTLPHGAAYAGWGSAYPDFPGLFLVASGVAGGLGVAPFDALTIVVPALAALSVLPLFLLFRRLYPHDAVALLGAAVASVAMPRLFSIAHPAPLALGDLLCVACLWMFVEGRRDRRWYVPLGFTAGALVVTHHLSSYFFAVSALGGVLLLEAWRPGLWSRRFPLREFLFLAAFLTTTFAFWFYGTTSFVDKVLVPGFGGSPYLGFAAIEAVGLFAVGGSALFVRWRRRAPASSRRSVRLPTDRSFLRDAAVIGVVVAAAVSALLVVPIPGTTQSTTPATIAWFSPLLALGVLCAGSRRAVTPARLGPFSLAWIGAVGGSAAVMLLFAGIGSADPHLSGTTAFADAIAPGRHVEYLFLPIGLLIAVSLARLVARAGDRGGRRALAAAGLAVVLVVAANAAIAYPPQADFGGFEEGLTNGDAALWMWVGIALPPNVTVASDHRLSSMLFGFDSARATWVSTPALFVGSVPAAAFAELRGSGVPSAVQAIEFVAVDGVMLAGVALGPSDLALPLSSAAEAWLASMPFVPLYENGAEVVYLVDAPFVP